MEQGKPAGGFLHELGWLGMGFVLPCASLTFYRQAARRKVIWAVVFFVIFSLVLTGVATIDLASTMGSLPVDDIRDAFESGQMPTITIQDGLARVDGAQTRVLFDGEGMFIAIDMTGTYRQLDRTRYSQGILLTPSELHIMNNTGRYQVIPLSELQQALNANPIVIDADTVTRAWQAFAALFTIVAIVGLAIWNVPVRFVYVAVLALVAWGFVVLMRPGTGYGPVLATGLYAVVPALYLDYLLGRLGISFCFLQTLILLAIWAVALWGMMDEVERPLRGWRALAGIPFLLVLVVDFCLHPSFGAALVWAVALVTMAVLVGVGLWTRRQSGPIAPAGPLDGAGGTPGDAGAPPTPWPAS